MSSLLTRLVIVVGAKEKTGLLHANVSDISFLPSGFKFPARVKK